MFDIINMIIGKPAQVGADKPKTESSTGNRLWSLIANLKSWFESMPYIFFRCTKPANTVAEENVSKRDVTVVTLHKPTAEEETKAMLTDLKKLNITGPSDVTRGLNLISQIRSKSNDPKIERKLEKFHSTLRNADLIYRNHSI